MSNRPAHPTKQSPASGERRAMRAFTAQYRVAATLTLDALLEGDLEWIRLVDPDAGRLDDIIIARPRRLDAYQVKWESYEERITFRDLVSPSSVGGTPYPSPMYILGDGWRRLKHSYPDRAVRVHFLTNLSPSTGDQTGGSPADGPQHLQAFLRHAFDARAQWFAPGIAAPRSEWETPIQALIAASAIEAPEQSEFINSCNLDLGFRLPPNASTSPSDRRANDIRDIAHLFQRQVASNATLTRITKADLSRLLGWSRRFEFTFTHEFPVDERLYL